MKRPSRKRSRRRRRRDLKTKTPIKHVILIIGENRTFDHVFATYTPPAGQTVNNLLSEGIVTATGDAGANFGNAHADTPPLIRPPIQIAPAAKRHTLICLT